MTKRRKLVGEIDWLAYYSYEEIYAWLDSLQAEFPEFITIDTFGSSYEGRPLKIVKLSKKQVSEEITRHLTAHYQREPFHNRTIAQSLLKRIFTLASGFHRPPLPTC